MTPRPLYSASARRQRGFSLLELLVGLIVGLLVVVVALGAMMTTRTVTGSVSDLSQMQQQAAYAFRILGQQIRRTGSLHLEAVSAGGLCGSSAGAPSGTYDYTEVCLQANAGDFDLHGALRGVDNPSTGQYKLTVKARDYQQTSFSSDLSQRDCLNETPQNNALVSQFFLDLNPDPSTGSPSYVFKCASSSGQVQPILQNVADFEVRYLLATSAGIRYTNAQTVEQGNAWNKVLGVEVCLVIFGTERIDTRDMPPENRSYVGCTPATSGVALPAVDISLLDGVRQNRPHMAFRTVFQRRSQGTPVPRS